MGCEPMARQAASARVAIVLKGYPRLSETFIAQELLGLEQRGLAFTIFSLRRPYDRKSHPIHDEIRAPVVYLPEYLHREPGRVLAAWRHWYARKAYRRAFRVWLADFRRDPTRNRIRRFGQALVLARELGPVTTRIYAHFLHTPASVARYAAILRDLPWSCSAHAKDIYTTPDWEVREKLADLAWLVTCTRANVGHIRTVAPESAGKVELLYHGLDLARFPPPARSANLAGDKSGTVAILSVGRTVAKKGYGDLVRALARLPGDLDWSFRHIGGGPRAGELSHLAKTLGLENRVRWLGPMSQDEVLAAYRRSDIFVLASRIGDDGDRDGLPNVLMEAQSQGLACLSTRVSAIPELIIDGETGLLVAPDEPDELAAGMAELIRSRALRRRLGRAGEERVRAHFGHEGGIDRLARRFGLDPVRPNLEREGTGS